MSVQELTETVPVSQAAVSQHLRKLAEAGLVEMEADGARHVYRLRHEGLFALRRWLDSFWGDVLEAYASGDRPAKKDPVKEKQKKQRRKP
jgi:DNA-binding transcriptional ArsR family regulator